MQLQSVGIWPVVNILLDCAREMWTFAALSANMKSASLGRTAIGYQSGSDGLQRVPPASASFSGLFRPLPRDLKERSLLQNAI
jgi:hypothetical protein